MPSREGWEWLRSGGHPGTPGAVDAPGRPLTREDWEETVCQVPLSPPRHPLYARCGGSRSHPAIAQSRFSMLAAWLREACNVHVCQWVGTDVLIFFLKIHVHTSDQRLPLNSRLVPWNTPSAMQVPCISLQLPADDSGKPAAAAAATVRAACGGALTRRDVVEAVFRHYAARPASAVSLPAWTASGPVQ